MKEFSKTQPITTVNGVGPDENGNIDVDVSSKANIDLDNISTEGQNVIKELIQTYAPMPTITYWE